MLSVIERSLDIYLEAIEGKEAKKNSDTLLKI